MIFAKRNYIIPVCSFIEKATEKYELLAKIVEIRRKWKEMNENS